MEDLARRDWLVHAGSKGFALPIFQDCQPQQFHSDTATLLSSFISGDLFCRLPGEPSEPAGPCITLHVQSGRPMSFPLHAPKLRLQAGSAADSEKGFCCHQAHLNRVILKRFCVNSAGSEPQHS
eukprot:1051410-Amphidinium_carterae.1